MIFDVQKGMMIGYICSMNRSRGMIGMMTRVFCWFRGVATEVSAALRAYDGRESIMFYIRKRIYHNIFNPVSMVTRTAAVFVPFAGIWVEFQKLFPDRVGHFVAPQLFLQTIRTL